MIDQHFFLNYDPTNKKNLNTIINDTELCIKLYIKLYI